MNFSRAMIWYNVVFWALLLVMFFMGLFFGVGEAINFYVLAPMTFLYVLVVTFLVSHREPPANSPPSNSGAENGAHDESGNDRVQGYDSNSNHAAVPAPCNTTTIRKRRIEWIDKLKVMLISLVVVGHSCKAMTSSGAFLSIGDVTPGMPSYYTAFWMSGYFLLKPAVVPLFFFVSGYFSATSRIKYGPNIFLKKSFWRLWPPAFLWWLVVNPLNAYLGYALVRPSNMSYSYSPGQAATWFLTWLLVFNCCYAMIDVDQQGTAGGRMEIPRFGQIIKVGLVVSALQLGAGLLVLFSGTQSFAEMPCLLVGDGYFNALGYASGVLAKTHGWLNQSDDSNDSNNLLCKARTYVLTVTSIVIILVFLCYAPGSPGESLGTSTFGFLVISIIISLPIGPYGPCAWVLLMKMFQKKSRSSSQEQLSVGAIGNAVDETSKKSSSLFKFLSGGAFSAYLIQYYFITLYTYAYIEILDKTQGIDLQFVNTTHTAEPALGDGDKFGGFVFVAVLSLISSFLVGGLLKKSPVIGKRL